MTSYLSVSLLQQHSMTAIYIALAGLIVSFLVQFGGVVWFASKMSAAISQLNVTTHELHAAVKDLSGNNALLDRRLAVIEDRAERAVRVSP